MKQSYSVMLFALLAAAALPMSASAQGTVTVTATALAPVFSPGASTPVVSLSFSSITLSPVIDTVKVERTGTATNTDVSTAKLYHDLNKNGVVDGGDTQVGTTQSFAGTPASVTFSGLNYSPSTSENLLIVYDVAPGANTSNTAGAYMGTGYVAGALLTTVTFNGITTADQPLPVELVSFTAQILDNKTVFLKWDTQSEVENAGFNILRRDPGSASFNLIASYTNNDSLRGLGTSTTGKLYNFTDTRVTSGWTYQYKVQSVSTNGTTKDLNTISVTVDPPKSYALNQNYPNPFNPSTTIGFDLKVVSRVTLEVFNMLGQKVIERDYGNMTAGHYQRDLDMDRYASGVYFYVLRAIGTNGQMFQDTKTMLMIK